MSDSAVTDIPDGVVETVVTAACNANRTGGCGWPKCAPLAGCRIFVLGVQGAIAAMPPPPEREALRIAVERLSHYAGEESRAALARIRELVPDLVPK